MARSKGEKDRMTRAAREEAAEKAAAREVTPQNVKIVATEAAETRRRLDELVALTQGAPSADVQLELPSADKLVTSEMSLAQQHERLMIYRTIAQRAIYAMAPRLVWKLAKKIEDHTEPGDTRLIVETLKGLGLLEPSAPLSDTEREKKLKRQSELEQMSVEDMKRRLLEGTR